MRELSDVEFDRIYPSWARPVSDTHWTPVAVARRAAELLAGDHAGTILDVGSGAGKFCLMGAAVTRAVFHGVEQRRSQVELAREAALRTGLLRARFTHGDAFAVDWSRYDGFYLFNPFWEHLASGPDPFLEPIARSRDLYQACLDQTYRKLMTARAGARLALYHGFGGMLPDDYRLVLREPAGTHMLELWQKEEAPRGRAA